MYINLFSQQVNAILEKHRSAHSSHSSIKEYITGGGEKHLLEIRQRISSLQEKISSLESQKQLLNEKNRNLEKEITNQRVSDYFLDCVLAVQPTFMSAKIVFATASNQAYTHKKKKRRNSNITLVTLILGDSV